MICVCIDARNKVIRSNEANNMILLAQSFGTGCDKIKSLNMKVKINILINIAISILRQNVMKPYRNALKYYILRCPP